MRSNDSRELGFTLIELLIVAMLAAGMMMSISHALVQGIKIYNRICYARGYEDASFFMEKMTRDLKNSVNFSQIPFEAMPNSLSFGMLEAAGAAAAKPVQVTYQYDAEKKRVMRFQGAPFFEEKISPRSGTVVLDGVQGLKFEFKPGRNALPNMIEVILKVGQGRDATELRKEILIPISQSQI